VRVCNKVALIDRGKLRTYDSVARLKKKYKSLERAYLKLTEEET